MSAQVSSDIAAEYYASLPEWLAASFRSAVAPELSANDGSIILQCWTEDGALLFEEIRQHLEQYLPSGCDLVILGGEDVA